MDSLEPFFGMFAPKKARADSRALAVPCAAMRVSLAQPKEEEEGGSGGEEGW